MTCKHHLILEEVIPLVGEKAKMIQSHKCDLRKRKIEIDVELGNLYQKRKFGEGKFTAGFRNQACHWAEEDEWSNCPYFKALEEENKNS